ncbi:MAG: hypothetical protein AAFR60_00210 [Pseudomonadota bacterium]
MDLIKSIALAMMSLLGVWMVVVLYCQFQALRFVHEGRQWRFKRFVRKWDFDMARGVLHPEGHVWLARVEWLLRSGIALLALAAFMAVGIIVFGAPPNGGAQ